MINKKFVAFLFLLLSNAFTALAQSIPISPQNYVTDLADALSPEQEDILNDALQELEEISSHQLFVLLGSNLSGRNIDELGAQVANQWEIGQEGKDNGVLITAFINDRKVRIDIGYGLEGELVDLEAQQIIEEQIKPKFRSKAYFEGLKGAITQIIAQIYPAYKVSYRNETLNQRQQMLELKEAQRAVDLNSIKERYADVEDLPFIVDWIGHAFLLIAYAFGYFFKKRFGPKTIIIDGKSISYYQNDSVKDSENIYGKNFYIILCGLFLFPLSVFSYFLYWGNMNVINLGNEVFFRLAFLFAEAIFLPMLFNKKHRWLLMGIIVLTEITVLAICHYALYERYYLEAISFNQLYGNLSIEPFYNNGLIFFAATIVLLWVFVIFLANNMSHVGGAGGSSGGGDYHSSGSSGSDFGGGGGGGGGDFGGGGASDSW